MIYTVTLNPSLDYIMDFADFREGAVNRTIGERLTFGGKGLNVSFVLKQLSLDSVAVGFKAGQTGEMIEQLANESGIRTDFIPLESGMSRINVKLRYGGETEANASGIIIGDEQIALLRKRLSVLQSGDTLALCGSLPKGAPTDLYKILLDDVRDKGIRTVVDTSGDALMRAVEGKPFLIKPNADELSEIFGAECNSVGQIIDCAKKLQNAGAENVLVSRGKDGAVYIGSDGEITEIAVPKIDAKGTTGAGDSMVAGFIAGLQKGEKYALRLAAACGCAAAQQGHLAASEDIAHMLEKISF